MLSASVSAGFEKLINFNFDDYFIKKEAREKPALGAYNYVFKSASNNGQYFVNLILSADLAVDYRLPFDDTPDDTAWTLTLIPEVAFGGKQIL